jgi:hypothetical protein
MLTALLAAATLTASQPPAAPMPPAEAACMFMGERVETFVRNAAADDTRGAVSASWLSLPMDRADLAATLTQEGRQRGSDAPFAMGYNPEFARAIEGLTDAQLDLFHDGLTTGGPIQCPGIETQADPFNDDIRSFQRWAEEQMMNPDPGAPPGAATLAISRPVHFDGGARVLVAEAYTFTPIPISRPPSASLVFAVYQRDGAQWRREASIIAARAG